MLVQNIISRTNMYLILEKSCQRYTGHAPTFCLKQQKQKMLEKILPWYENTKTHKTYGMAYFALFVRFFVLTCM